MELQLMILAISVVFFVATILSMFGKGGGEFYVPLLLTVGITFQTAATTSLLCLIFSGSAMTFVYHRKMRQVDWLLATVLFSTAGIFSFFGGFFSGRIPPFYLKIIFALTILVAAFVMYMKKKFFVKKAEELTDGKEPRMNGRFVWHRKSPEGDFEMNLLYVLPAVGVVGFFAGMLGISGGGLIVPIIIILGSVPTRTAFATNSVLVLLTSLMGFAGRGLGNGIDIYLSIPIATAALVGALTGSTLSKRVDIRSLERYFIIVLIIAALWMLYKAFA